MATTNDLERSPDRSCFGKTRYQTETFAHTVAADCFRERGHWLRVYACDVAGCGGYHLTHQAALPKPGWRPPEPSKREHARARREEHSQRRRRRDRWDE